MSSLLPLPTGTVGCSPHVSARAVMPLTKLCASMAPKKYTCILTPTCRGPELFPGSSQRSYRQGAMIVSSRSGPRVELLSSGQVLRRNKVVTEHSMSKLCSVTVCRHCSSSRCLCTVHTARAVVNKFSFLVRRRRADGKGAL